MQAVIFNLAGPDATDLACVMAWAKYHNEHGGAPVAVTSEVVDQATAAVKARSWDLFGDVTDLMELVDDPHPIAS